MGRRRNKKESCCHTCWICVEPLWINMIPHWPAREPLCSEKRQHTSSKETLVGEIGSTLRTQNVRKQNNYKHTNTSGATLRSSYVFYIVGFGPLLAIAQRAHIGTQIVRKHASRELA